MKLNLNHVMIIAVGAIAILCIAVLILSPKKTEMQQEGPSKQSIVSAKSDVTGVQQKKTVTKARRGDVARPRKKRENRKNTDSQDVFKSMMALQENDEQKQKETPEESVESIREMLWNYRDANEEERGKIQGGAFILQVILDGFTEKVADVTREWTVDEARKALDDTNAMLENINADFEELDGRLDEDEEKVFWKTLKSLEKLNLKVRERALELLNAY